MKSRLAIFDLDGTLYDTRAVNFKAYQLALREYKIELDENFFYKNCNGKFYKQFLPIINSTLTEADIKTIHDYKKSIYYSCLQNATPNENLIQIIKNIHQEYYIALVTTASKKNAEEILMYFGHYNLFDLIITQEDTIKKKPDPEGFLKAMQYFNIKPEQTIIFEDSDDGVSAALQCGASVCKIFDYCTLTVM
ncbi:MAG: HAD-IA family hydrolase [Desulfovibrionaceae bacterium]|nr:HAD-IA family hydrolase [Desulfovibrionaceae bacterium]